MTVSGIMGSIDEARKALVRLTDRSRYETMVEVAAIFTELMELDGIKPIIVGGLAVEIYTRGQYTTQDIDLVLPRRDLANNVFLRLGFVKEGRHWFHPEIDVGIEIPGDALEDADKDKVTKLHLPSGKYVYVIGIEDIILDRLRACIYWKSPSDCEWGFRMVKVHRERLDMGYLLTAAGRERPPVLEKLREWLAE